MDAGIESAFFGENLGNVLETKKSPQELYLKHIFWIKVF